MVKICQTGLLTLNFEIIPKKRIFRFLPKISAGHAWSWKFPNPWTLRVSGMGGYTSKCEKSQNHCTLQYIYYSVCLRIFVTWRWALLYQAGTVVAPCNSNTRRKIRFKEGNARCRNLTKLICKGTLWHVFIGLRAPSPPRFMFGAVLQFCRFWMWSDTECTIPVEYGIQQNPIPPPPP